MMHLIMEKQTLICLLVPLKNLSKKKYKPFKIILGLLKCKMLLIICLINSLVPTEASYENIDTNLFFLKSLQNSVILI